MISIFQHIETIFGNYYFLICINTFSFILKSSILFILKKRKNINSIEHVCWTFLLWLLISSIITDSAWLIKLLSLTFFSELDYKIIIFWIRISWGFFVVQYHSLSLFIESLIEKKYQIPIYQKILLAISSIFILFFISISLININCTSIDNRPHIEIVMQSITTYYLLIVVMVLNLLSIAIKIKQYVLPHILKKQFNLLIQFLIIPQMLSDLIHLYPSDTVTNSYAFSGFSTIFLTCAIFYCTRKIMGLRFLNAQQHVQAPPKITFVNDFKLILDQLSRTTNIKELTHITQTFFKQSLDIPVTKVFLYIKPLNADDVDDGAPEAHIINTVESYFHSHKAAFDTVIQKETLFIFDELDFSNFYEQTPEQTAVLQFLSALNADIFLPIFYKHTLVAYIIVERHARFNEFYSNVDRDEMIVFASYLGSVINLLQSKNLDMLMKQELELRQELYHKHQEIIQYKESIRSFLRTQKHHQIGILFYKKRHFIIGNQAAKELLPISLQQEGHPIIKQLKHLARQTENYQAAQSCFIKDSEGNTIVVSAVPHLEQQTIILTLSYPDITDVIKPQLDLLHDPSKWDYLLYLQTTQSGQLVNELIPGNGELLLNFKINLLKAALSNKPILLTVPDEDLTATVELLHHISLRTMLQTIALEKNTDMFNIAAMIFGINPLLQAKEYTQKPLLESLNNIGTLFIKNIHFLNQDIQERLTEYTRFGFFKLYKSDHKIISNVRLIFSTNMSFAQLLQEEHVSHALLHELKQTTIALPSLHTLPESEFIALAEGFTQQFAPPEDQFFTHIALTEKEKARLIYKRPTSLHDLKLRIQTLIAQKTQKIDQYQEISFSAPVETHDPDLIEAKCRGKEALKNKETFTRLWNQFNKNQNKIAAFLGVHRSSVNRRCKEYNLL
ncbi:MAG TPA: sigma 54-interacting transcriptional regulator [Candidatus Bathyarchaeia archaeon]|nr:sigma 54-interacting transcriptional regulator [Candidatus Bathyarchaeia archaeon]